MQGAFHGFQFPGYFMQPGTGSSKGGFQFFRGSKAGFLVNAHGSAICFKLCKVAHFS